MMKRYLALIAAILVSVAFFTSRGSADSIRQKMQWFADAGPGIFIDWCMYAVNGLGENWSFHNKEISHADYLKQMKGFKATRNNPGQWLSPIKESGARYAVITTKHQDASEVAPAAGSCKKRKY